VSSAPPASSFRPEAADVPPRAVEEPAPLSFAQERLWLLGQLEPGLAIDNRPLAFRLRGPLDARRLEACLTGVARRHRVLATAFPAARGRPVLADGEPPQLRVQDLTGTDAGGRAAAAADLAAADAIRCFDLAHGPMLRALLLRLSAADHVLAVTTHHIVADGWSDAVLWREASVLYDASGPGRRARLGDPPMQYAEFAAWQRTRLQGPLLRRELDYWRDRLAGAGCAELPADRPRPAVASAAGARLDADLSPALTQALARVARRHGTSLFMLLLAALQVLVARYVGEDDVVIGVPVAGRTHPRSEAVVGPFVNLLALRGDLSGNPPLGEVLTRTRRAVLEGLDHQELPFEKLVEELAPGQRLTRSPLGQVAFNWRSFEPPRFEPAGLTCEPFELPVHQARFDLALEGRLDAGSARLRAEWRTDLFDAATVRAFVESYRVLLAGVAAGPERRLSELPLLTPRARRQLVPAATSGRREDASSEPGLDISSLLVGQARAQRGRPAFVWGDERLSFAGFERRTRLLARRLKVPRDGSETRVALYSGRSLAAVVGAVGILRSGAAYVPLDCSCPAERLRWILEEVKPAAIVTEARHREELAGFGLRLVCVDEDGDDGNDGGERAVPPGARDLAYVIYTSGSTGRPKGVAAGHGVLASRLRWMWREFPFDRDEVAAVKTPLHFVDSLWEMLGALLQGRPAVVVPEDVVRDPDALVRALADHRVTRLWVLPSLLKALLDRFPDLGTRLPRLRFWVASGEALPPDVLARFRAAAPEARLFNLYGTSEVWDATWHEASAADAARPRVPVGRPIDRVRACVVDRWMNPLPVGARGELYVGGPGVALGYLNRPELTAERFVPDPFGGEGARLSRTGDLARWLPDGSLDILGRADAQIKIRGFRIEAGEVEQALAGHPGVREAAVVARGSGAEARLVCHFVARGTPPPEGELRAFLRRTLPPSMIPARFVPIVSLPTTRSGKLDRQRLPEPPENPTAYPGPCRDPLEARLSAIFCRTLGLSRVGVEDDFFDLGGHSLLAVELFARIEREIGQALTLATLFAAPTVAGLAERLRQQVAPAPRSALVAIQTGGTRTPLFCVHGLGGEVLGYRPLARLVGPERPVYGLQRVENGAAERFRLERIAAEYLDEVRSLRPRGPYLLAGLSFGGMLALEMARQLRDQGESVPFLGLFDTWAPGYPRYRPLWRRALAHLATLARLPAREGREYVQVRLRALGSFTSRRSAMALRLAAAALGRPSPAAAFALEGPYLWALREYAPRPYSGPITLFRALGQPVGCVHDPTNGWAGLARGRLEVHEVPGEHASLIFEPNVRAWAPLLRARIEAATGGEPG